MISCFYCQFLSQVRSEASGFAYRRIGSFLRISFFLSPPLLRSFFPPHFLSFVLSFFRSFVLSFFRSFFPVSSFLSDLIFLLLAVYFVGSETKPINQRVQRNATRENEEEKTMRRGGRIDQSEIKPLYQSRKTDERNARMVTDMAGYQITYVEVRVTLVLCNCLPNTS